MMGSSSRKVRDDQEEEIVLPLLTLGSGSELDEYDDAEGASRTASFDREKGVYKTRNDAMTGTSYKKRTPLPLLQLIVLTATRLAEPIAYTQIFPGIAKGGLQGNLTGCNESAMINSLFVNQMMEDLKVTNKKSEIGYYSGAVDSLFAVCQLFTILQWGRLSDRIGRKPVILLGLLGVAISTSSFGLSKTFWWAVISRALAGALSGNTAVVQSVVGEITDETNQALAFPLTGISWSLGCIIGPMIGGNFVNPEKYYPETFGKIEILRTYPYLLPCLLSAVLTMCSIIFGAVFLKESLPSKVRLDTSLPSPISASRIEKPPPSKGEMPISVIFNSPSIKPVFRNYFLLSISASSFDVVFILLAYSPLSLGGLARSPDEIGYALAFSGVVGSFVTILVFPYLQKRFNSVRLYRALMLLWPILFAILPFLSVLARWSAPPEAFAQAQQAVNATLGAVTEVLEADGLAPTVTFPGGALLWIGIGVALAVLRLGHMCFTLNTILIRNAAPSSEALGSTFGLAQTVACVARAGSPAFVSTLFALSKKYQLMQGNMVWVVMFVIALAGFVSTLYIRDGTVERSHKAQEADECEMRLL